MPEAGPVQQAEVKHLKEVRRMYGSIDSPDLKMMYAAAGKMMAYETGMSLLPKAMDLLGCEDLTIRKLMFRTAARSIFGRYVTELLASFDKITPAEREQVLQLIEERFRFEGAPLSSEEQKTWIAALAKLGREHESTVFAIMAHLGRLGIKWVTDKVKNHVETVSPGAVQRISSFPDPARKRLVQLATKKALERKRELLPYIIETMEQDTIRYAQPVLREGGWRERVMVATKVGILGIRSCSGMVLDLLADADWRVKQALLENVDLRRSKFTAVLKMLGYVVTDSHARVRGAAERLILQLGATECPGSDLETQRKRIEKKFRKQLLRAAPLNTDIDSSWLGIDLGAESPIPVIEDTGEAAEGVSLSDITEEKKTGPPPSTLDLLAALRGARDAAKAESTQSVMSALDRMPDESSVSDMVVDTLRSLSKSLGKDVPVESLRKELLAKGVSEKDFDEAMKALERDGIVYRSGKGTVSYVEMDL
ncbi:MAG: hypothetical protein ACTSV8_06440 [Candidatus Thorarchaeota archaeon]